MEYLGTHKLINKTKPLVSVCVITFNHVTFIEQCLDGILMQVTNFPIEIIVGEDDSTDGTRKICKKYAEKYPDKIRLFLRSEKDKIYINGNKTGRFNVLENLKSSRGEYIAMCEGDDYWTDPCKLQKQIDFLENNEEYSLCFHNADIIDSKNNKIRIFNNSFIPLTTDVSYILKNNWYIPTASILFRNNIQIPGWFEKVINGDYALQLLLTANGEKVFYINEVLSVYRDHSMGISNIFNIGLNTLSKSLLDINLNFDKYTNGKYKKLICRNIATYTLKIIAVESKKTRSFWHYFYLYLKCEKIKNYRITLLGRVFFPYLYSASKKTLTLIKKITE